LTHKPNQAGSRLILGGVDPKFAAGSFKYYPVSMEAWWVLKFSGVKVNNSNVALDSAIVDSGTSILMASPAVANDIKTNLGLPVDAV